MKRPARCRIPAAAGQILATARDHASALARLTSLVVESGFADECVIETCSPDEPGDANQPVPRFEAWVSSVMHAPLVARGTVLGSVAFYRFEGGAVFDEQERELAELLAWCVAMVVDTGQPVSRFNGAAVRRARQERGWTQARLASAIGRPVEEVQWIERGVLVPSVALADSLAQVLGDADGDDAREEPASRTGSGLHRRVGTDEASGDE